ncbi:hypothetical protein J1N35_017650 [Gossypium stocksii]|uniref:50S ribosomal protein L22, chloroplastic n=1 Tax=Gossypium stocksii TaxID=47602 RepID=A0A9D3VPE3_9ROSI|nr:hypothetical protein J1N35_017650 [Gossypium stocksii]
MFPKTYTKYLKYSAWASSLGNGAGKKDQFHGQTDMRMQLDVERHLQCALRRIRRRLEHNYSQSSNYSSTSTSRLSSSLLPSELPGIQRLWKPPSASISSPLYQYFQQLGISTSRKLLAGSSEETPISSPLTPDLAIDSGKTEEKKVVANRTKVQAVLKKIKQSPKKVYLVAALIRGMRDEDALLQLQVTVKRAAKTVIHSARANATHNHELDPDRVLVGNVSEKSVGRSGIKERLEYRLTVVVRVMTAEEEAEMARLRVSKFRKLTKRERRLVPHKLIETTPIWNHKADGF